jgi:hypothetical protein
MNTYRIELGFSTELTPAEVEDFFAEVITETRNHMTAGEELTLTAVVAVTA